MTQYYSRTDIPYAGDSNFTIPFSYIDKTDIHVYINDTLISTWVWLNDSQINITSTLSAGDVVSIRRITPIDEKIVTYQNMSMVLNDDNLNLSQDQVLNAVQEVYDNNVSFQIDVNAQIDEIDTKVDTANATANQALSNSETAISIANEALSNSEDAVATANAAETKADNAVSTANTASSNASQAISTANEANTNAQAAVSTANSAADDASEALSKANTAISTANTAKDTADIAKDTADEALADSATALANSETAINTANDAADDATEAVATANTANTNASNAVSTANSASSAANSAVSTANSASTAANNAVSTANTASTNASAAIARAEEAIEIAQTAVSQGLTPATATSLGGIKVGDNLSITADGTLSADAQSIEVDDDLSTTSENPVQNKVITNALNDKQEKLTAGTDLEIVEGSTLPAGYVQLKSITSTTTQYINTKISMTANYKAVIVGRLTQQPSFNFTTILGADNQNNNSNTQGKYNIILGWGNASNGFYTENCIPSGAIVDYTYSSYPWDTETHTFTITVTPTRTTLNIDGTIDAISLPPAAWDTPTPLYLFTRNTAANGRIGSITPFELEKIEQYQNGVLVFNGIPCKLGDIVGLYNTVTNEFLPNSGTGAFVEGDVIPNETIINFTNTSGYALQTDVNNTLALKQDLLVAGTDLEIVAGSGTSNTVSGTNSITLSNAAANSLSSVIVYGKCSQTGTPTTNNPIDIVCNNGVIKYNTGTSSFYTEGTVETVTDSLNNTATAEMLLGFGNYIDTQDLLRVSGTRKVGLMVLTGTEEFDTTTLANCYSLVDDLGNVGFTDRTVYCTHFQHSSTLPAAGSRQGYALIGNRTNAYTVGFGATTEFSTVALFKSWLATQYANGTPVIIAYPLATPTTFSATAQTLNTKSGNNQLTITQSAISNLNIKATYTTDSPSTINFTNDSGYTKNVGTVTSVNGIQPDGSGNVAITIPTVNDGTLTITQDGNTLGTFTANQSGNAIVDIPSGGSSRNIGEIVSSTIPLTDAGLHLLDGALISGSGSYSAFVDYIVGLVADYPDLFDTEANWQSAVTQYGVCGKFVYDSVNNTVRLPKITGIVEGTTNVTALGDLVEAGLPNIEGRGIWGKTVVGTGAIHTFSTGNYAGTQSATGETFNEFDASLSNPIYGNSATVQPQTIKVLYYIVIATSTKTEIEVDIDEIATDLNGKADVDGSNMVNSVKNFDGGWVHSMSYLISSTTSLAAQTSRSFDLSSYLPNDNYQYEVIVSVTGTTSTTSGQTFNTWFKSDIFTNTYSFVGTRVITRTSSSMNSGTTVAIPVGTGRSIAIYNGSTYVGSITELWLSGYRRIGTNQ